MFLDSYFFKNQKPLSGTYFNGLFSTGAFEKMLFENNYNMQYAVILVSVIFRSHPPPRRYSVSGLGIDGLQGASTQSCKLNEFFCTG